MAVLTGIRCANITPSSRRQVVTSMVPLLPGAVTGSGAQLWTAVGAVVDGEERGDIGVQATRVGATRADGSWRMARIHFPASLDAATTGYRQYPLWQEHTFSIDTAPGAIPAHTVDPTTALGLSGLEFTLRTRGRPLFRDPNNNNRPARNAVLAAEHVATWTADAGRIPDYHAPYTVSTPAKVELADTAGLTNTWIRAYRVSGRVLPEASGGSATEPSIVGTLFYEVASQASGMGRFVRFWFEAANSLCTDDSDPRDDTTVEYELQQDIILEVRCSTTSMLLVVDTSAGYTQTAPVPITDGYRIQVFAHDQKPGRNDWVFPHLMGAMLRGYIVFPGSMDATQQSTRNAINYQGGDQAFVEAVATTWAQTSDCYGAFGVVHRHEDVGHASLSAYRDAVASEALNQVGRMRDPRRGGQRNSFPSYTGQPATSVGGAAPNFGPSLLGMYASTAHPDLRAVYLSCKQDVQRPMNLRNNAGDVFDCSAETTPPSGLTSKVDSAVFMYGGQPWWLDFGQQQGGKSAGLAALSAIPVANSGGSDGVQTAYDNDHQEFACPIFYAHLTADRYTLDRQVVSLQEIALNTLPTPDAYDSLAYGGGVVWNNSGALSNGVPRGHGRPIKMQAHIYSLTGSADLKAVIAERVIRNWEHATLGVPVDSQPAGLNVAVAHVIRDNSLFPTAFATVNGACSTGAKVWDDPGRTSWIPWQQTLFIEGLYACCRMLSYDATYATDVARGLEICAKVGKAILLYGYTIRGTEFGSMFGFDLLHNPSSLGDPPDWNWGTPTQRYCAQNGNVPGTSSDKFLDDAYGPLNPDRANVPFYRDNPSGSFLYTTLPGALLGAYLNPTDSAVQAAIAAKLTPRKVMPTLDSIRAGAASATFPSAWHQSASIIPQPFTRWTSGPVTYQASARISVGDIALSAAYSVTRAYLASARIDLGDITLTATARRVEPSYDGSARIDLGDIELAANPTVFRVLYASARIDIGDIGLTGLSTQRSDATDDVDVEPPGGGVGGGGGDDPQTPNRNTLRDALGPNLDRARGVKLVKAGGQLIRVPVPIAYRSRLKRDWWW